MTNAVARASVTIAAPNHRVWEALTDPSWIVRYMPVSDFVADWREGGSIAWKGQLGRKVYDITGTVWRVEEGQHLEYEYGGVIPRVSHLVAVALSDDPNGTMVALTEDNHATARELEHANGAWRLVLNLLKTLLEKPDDSAAGATSDSVNWPAVGRASGLLAVGIAGAAILACGGSAASGDGPAEGRVEFPTASTQSSTAAPTRSPAPATAVPPTVSFVTVLSPVRRGGTGQVTVSTAPGLTCSITVRYASGPSSASGLTPKASDASGRVSWSWNVGGNTTRGTWPIDVQCGDGSAHTTFEVQ